MLIDDIIILEDGTDSVLLEDDTFLLDEEHEVTTSACDITIDWSDLSVYCSSMPKPLLVTGLLIQWLRLHFSNPGNLENPLLVDQIWDQEVSKTGIVIDSVYRWNPALTEKRPGIFVKRGPWKFLTVGIDNRHMPVANQPCRIDTHTVIMQGSHTIFCIGGEAAEAEILATETYRELMSFGPAARKTFNFLRFVISDLGDINILEEATENFVIPIVISYGIQEKWQICPPAYQQQNFLNAVENQLKKK